MRRDITFHARVAIFFKLDIHPNIQKQILSGEGFRTSLEMPLREIAPGVAARSPNVPIAELEDAKIIYVGERYLFLIEANLDKIYGVSKKVSSAFENSGYPFSEMVRYCEFNFPDQPLEIPNLVEKIRAKINVPIDRDISDIFGTELKPYSFSLSYPETPLADKWTHITFTPEPNNPKNCVILTITQRTPTYSEMVDFLSDMESKIERVRELFLEVKI